MEYIEKNIPLWQVTTWDKNFKNVDKEWQPKTIKYKYLLSDELDSLRVDDGDVRILYTGKDVGYTTEELAGDNISEGEIVSIPWGGIPTVKYHKGKFVTGDNRIATSNDTSKLTNKYLYYFMQGNISEIASYYRGASLKHPCMKDVLKMTISYPSVQEQDKICSQFDVLEQLLETRKQELQLLDNLIQVRFVEMFGTLQDNRNGYNIVIFEEVCSIIKDGTHQTPTYTEDTEKGYKFLSSKDVMTQKIDWTDVKYIAPELHEKLYATIHPQRNDILMSKNGVNYGVAAINDTDEVFDIYVSLALLRPTEVIDPVYFRCVINNPDTKRQFDKSIKGIGVPNLHLGEIKKTKILLPPIELQKEYASFVNQVDQSKAAVQKSLEETQLLFDSLMQEYFG